MMEKLSKVPFEEALDLTGYGWFNLQMFGLCSSIISAMVFELYSVSYVVPASACELNTTSSQQGLMAGLPLIGVIATSHLWGYLADKHGRRKMLCFSMTIGYVAGSLAAFSPNWIIVSVLKFMSSAAVSGASALALALLGESTPTRHRSMLLLLTTSAFITCSGLMAVLSIPVLPLKFSYHIPILDIQFNSWRLLNLIFSFPCLLTAIWAIYSCESPKYLLSAGEDLKSLEILERMFAVNTGKSEDMYQVKSIILDEDNGASSGKGFWTSIAAQTVPMFKPPLLKPTLFLGLLISLVFICGNSFIVWLPYMVDAFMSSVESGATGLTICEMIRHSKNTTVVDKPTDCSMNDTAMTMVFSICVLLAGINALAGLVLKYIGKRRLYMSIQMLSGTAALCISFSSNWVISAVLLLTLMMSVLNFGFLTSFTVDLFPTYVKAKAVCLMLMLGRASTILGINVLKELIETRCEAAFYIFGVLTIGAAILGLLLPPDKSLFNKKDNKLELSQSVETLERY